MTSGTNFVAAGQPPAPLRSHWLARGVARLTFHFAPFATRVVRTVVVGLGRWPDLTIEPFTAVTDDGVRLDAVRVRASKDVPAKLPVVMTHGWLEVKEIHLSRTVRLLTQQGHDVLLFDLRAHGKSTGRTFCFGVHERNDVTAVITHGQRRGWIGERVITIGFSAGAALVIAHAPTDERVAGVVAFAPFIGLREAVDSFRLLIGRGIVTRRWLERGFEATTASMGFSWDDVSVGRHAPGLKAPLLLVSAGRDAHLPPEIHTERLAECFAPNACELFHVPEADHITICRHTWPAVNQRLIAFCAEISSRFPSAVLPAH